MAEERALARRPHGRLELQEDVEFVVQTKLQRRAVLGVMLGGLALIVATTAGTSSLLPIALGAGLGAVSTKIRTLGRGWLKRWVKYLELPSTREPALAKLEELATRRPLITSSARMEAGGHAALARIEAGELERALQIMVLAYRDAGAKQRQRLPDQGFLGEAVHALLTRLAPAGGGRVVPAARIVPDLSSRTVTHADFGLAMALLRALEGAERGKASAVSAWREAVEHERAPKHPVLIALVGASLYTSASLDEELEDQLLARMGRLAEPTREAIERWFPRTTELGRQGYRAPARNGQTSVALVPTQLQGLSTGAPPSRWLPATSRRGRIGMVVTNLLLSAALVGDLVGLLVIGLMVTVVAPTLISPFVLRQRRRDTLELAGVLRGEADPRALELKLMPARGGPTRGDASNLHPFDLNELRLLVGLRRAEDALAEGNEELAREFVQWWMDTVVEQKGFGGISPLAIGASALRVAALTGQVDAAASLERALEQAAKRGDARVPRLPKTRTGHGDAPRAVAAASALRQLLAGELAGAAKTLRVASLSSEVGIELDAFERQLYGRMAARLHEQGEQVPDWVEGLVRERDPSQDAVFVRIG